MDKIKKFFTGMIEAFERIPAQVKYVIVFVVGIIVGSAI